jgi:hypothetical protein
MLPKKGRRISLTYGSELIVFSKKYGSYNSWSSNGTPHTNLLIVKGHFKLLPRINTAPIPIVLSIDIRTQTKPSFISEECKFWVKNTVMYCLQKPLTKMRSSPVIAFVSNLNLCYFIIFYLLWKLLFSTLVPVELIVPGIREANVLIWLEFRQAFPRLAQHSV